MARKTRIWYPRAMYHVMCRGHRGQAIFVDNEDRRVFLNRLLHAISDHSCNIPGSINWIENAGGREITPEEILKIASRYRSYYGEEGGVT